MRSSALPARRRRPSRSGQALVETCLVTALLCLFLFGLFEVARLFAAREVLAHSAQAGARARAVGFNDFMIRKVVDVASIPNAGPMRQPGPPRSGLLEALWRNETPGALWDLAVRSEPASPQLDVEQSRIPLYLAARHAGDLGAVLDYDRWDTVRIVSNADSADGMNRVAVRQDVPLVSGLHRLFYAEDEVRMRIEAAMDNHYPLYLE